MPYVIGITGNIACGKSTVARMLKQLGAEVIDADQVVHRLMRRGSNIWRRVIDEFGPSVLTPDGEIDRAALGAIVFRDPNALARLEAIVHPEVIRVISERVGESSAKVLVVEAVKLIESGLHKKCDSVWIVTCTREQQIERLMNERGLSRSDAEVRLQAQPALDEKLKLADVVIDNSGSEDDTWRQVTKAWRSVIRE